MHLARCLFFLHKWIFWQTLENAVRRLFILECCKVGGHERGPFLVCLILRLFSSRQTDRTVCDWLKLARELSLNHFLHHAGIDLEFIRRPLFGRFYEPGLFDLTIPKDGKKRSRSLLHQIRLGIGDWKRGQNFVFQAQSAYFFHRGEPAPYRREVLTYVIAQAPSANFPQPWPTTVLTNLAERSDVFYDNAVAFQIGWNFRLFSQFSLLDHWLYFLISRIKVNQVVHFANFYVINISKSFLLYFSVCNVFLDPWDLILILTTLANHAINGLSAWVKRSLQVLLSHPPMV